MRAGLGLLLSLLLAGCMVTLDAREKPALGVYPTGDLNGPSVWTFGLRIKF